MKPNSTKKMWGVLIALAMMFVSNADAQTFKSDYATKLVLASGGVSPANTLTMIAPTLASSYTLTFPATAGTNGYMLTTDGSGNLSWTNPSTGITLAGDITGSAGANVIAATAAAGNHAVTAINLGTASTLNADILKYDASLKVASSQLGVDLTHANTWTGVQTLPTSSAQGNNLISGINNGTASSLNADPLKHDATLTVASNQIGIDLTHANNWTGAQTITGANKFIYVDGNQTAGFVLTENASGVATWTNPSLGITLAGDITGPAGTNVIAATAAAGNHAVTAINLGTASTLNADILKYDATLKVASNQIGVDLSHANTWTGTQTFGAIAATSASVSVTTPTQNNLAVGVANSYYQISSTAAADLTGIVAGATGRVIVLENTGTFYINLRHLNASSSAANQIYIPGGGDILLGPSGTATLIYNGTNWKVVATS